VPLKEKEKILKFYVDKIEILCYSLYAFKVMCSGLQELQRIEQKLITLKIDRQTVNDVVRRFDDKINFNSHGTRIKRDVFDFVG